MLGQVCVGQVASINAGGLVLPCLSFPHHQRRGTAFRKGRGAKREIFSRYRKEVDMLVNGGIIAELHLPGRFRHLSWLPVSAPESPSLFVFRSTFGNPRGILYGVLRSSQDEGSGWRGETRHKPATLTVACSDTPQYHSKMLACNVYLHSILACKCSSDA